MNIYFFNFLSNRVDNVNQLQFKPYDIDKISKKNKREFVGTFITFVFISVIVFGVYV